MSAQIKLKRAYEKAVPGDGYRILIDRLWPRGVSKTSAHIDLWFKDIAPTSELRRWFGHDPERWTEFRRRYFAELKNRPAEVAQLRDILANHNVTFVYAAKDEVHNHAVALKEFAARATSKPQTKKPVRSARQLSSRPARR